MLGRSLVDEIAVAVTGGGCLVDLGCGCHGFLLSTAVATLPEEPAPGNRGRMRPAGGARTQVPSCIAAPPGRLGRTPLTACAARYGAMPQLLATDSPGSRRSSA